MPPRGRKKITHIPDIPVIVDETEIKVPTTKETREAMDKYRVFARSLFGEDYEVGTIKIKKGQPDPQKINMLMVEHEFVLAQKARGNSEDTIKAYIKNFNRLYDFLGFQYLRQGVAVVEDVLENIDKYGSAREIGASMPVMVLELPNFMAFYDDYMTNVRRVSKQTVLSSKRHVKAIIYFAQEQGWVKDYGISIKEVKPEIKNTFSNNELFRISKKPKLRSDNFVEYRTWVMIEYLASTGNRIGSVLALDVGDIDFENQCIKINRTKNNEPKLMPLVPEVRKILNEYIIKCRTDRKTGLPLLNEPLFCNQFGDRLKYDGARDAFKDYFEARGVMWEGFHKFRHSYAANWIRSGGNPLMLKEQLGHSSLAMTNRYANIYGMATKDEAEEFSLTKKLNNKTGRTKLRFDE
jgi:integrase/recombinase XerD